MLVLVLCLGRRGLGACGVLVCPIFSPPCYITKKGGNPGQALPSSPPEITAEGTYTCNQSPGQWAVQRGRLFCLSRSWLLRNGMGRGRPLSGLVSCTSGALTGSWFIETPLCEDIPRICGSIISWGQLSPWMLNSLVII